MYRNHISFVITILPLFSGNVAQFPVQVIVYPPEKVENDVRNKDRLRLPAIAVYVHITWPTPRVVMQTGGFVSKGVL